MNESTIGRLWLIMVDYGCDINDSGFINFLVDESTTGLWKGKKMLWYLKIRFFFGEEHVFWDGLSYWCLVGNGWVAGV